MAKKSSIERNAKRERLVKQFAARRSKLRATALNEDLQLGERFAARLRLAQLPRNAAPTRVRTRCLLSGRPRAVYRKLKLSRIALRDLASKGQIPGMVKSSW